MPDLKDAYSIGGPEDGARLYAEWAPNYDADFVATHGYVYHHEIARLLVSSDAVGPILDVGAGTGAVGEALANRDLVIDALDLSPEMLAVAEGKRVYDAIIRADLTATLPLPDARYGAIVSAGTFTHGHVGPGCLPELLRIARPGALFVLGINAQVFDGAGFGSALALHCAARRIGPLSFEDVPIYEGADHDAARDRALVALFRRS